MQFKDVNPGQTIYILNKSTVEFIQGRVIDRGFPYMVKPQPSEYTQPRYTQQPSNMVVDVTIEINGKQATYTIPENSDVTYTGDLVLATEEPLINNSLEKLHSQADNFLKTYKQNYEKQKAILEKSKKLLISINPSLKQQQEYETRLGNLEGSVNNIESMLKKLLKKSEE